MGGDRCKLQITEVSMEENIDGRSVIASGDGKSGKDGS